MNFTVDKGLSGMVVNHKPLSEIELKRLLLIFDEVALTPPTDNRYFLEKGAICYYEEVRKDLIALHSLNGFEMMERFKNVPSPAPKPDTLTLCSLLTYGGDQKRNLQPYTAVLMEDVLPLFNDEIYTKEEEQLLDQFGKAVDRRYINVLDYHNTDFYQQNGIHLKIAYDYDINDVNSYNRLRELLVREKQTPLKNMVIHHGWVELKGKKFFPTVNRQNFFTPQEAEDFDFTRQFYSIVGKINKKLALCGHYNLTPILLDKNIGSFYQYKVAKAQNTSDTLFQSQLENELNVPLQNLTNILLQSSSAFISDDSLSNVPLLQILAYKERCMDDLYSLRNSLADELRSLISQDLDKVPDAEIKSWIEKKVAPQLHNYLFNQQLILDKVLNRSVKVLVGTGVTALSFAKGLSPDLISLLSGVSPVFADEALSYVGKRRNSRQKQFYNTFAYYLNFVNKR